VFKTRLLSYYKEKLQKAKNKPETSRNYQRNIKNIEKQIKDIKIGRHTPKKTDLRQIRKEAPKRTQRQIDRIIQEFDTDNDSYFYFNNAKQSKFNTMNDLLVYVELTIIRGTVIDIQAGGSKDKKVVVFGMTSTKLSGRISDQEIHDTINKRIEEKNNKLMMVTTSDVTYQILNYKILKAEKGLKY
jgi:hypothetical protein